MCSSMCILTYVCTHVCMCRGTCTHMCEHVEDRLTFVITLQAGSCVLETGSLTGVELIKKPILTVQQAPGNFWPLPTQCSDCNANFRAQHPHVGSEDPNAVPCACTADTLSPEPPPRPVVTTLDNSVCAFGKHPLSFHHAHLTLPYPITALSHTQFKRLCPTGYPPAHP